MNDKILKKLFRYLEKSEKINDFPVAAIIYKNDRIISYGYNKRNTSNITTDHAEVVAIQRANKKIGNWNLQGYSMIVTLEPCHMCEHIIVEARLDTVYYIVPRYECKKSYKCTCIKKYDIDSNEKIEYIRKIKAFFKDKR